MLLKKLYAVEIKKNLDLRNKRTTSSTDEGRIIIRKRGKGKFSTVFFSKLKKKKKIPRSGRSDGRYIVYENHSVPIWWVDLGADTKINIESYSRNVNICLSVTANKERQNPFIEKNDKWLVLSPV